MKKILVPIFVLCLLMCLSLTVGAAALSPGISVICSEMKMVKTGVGLNSVSFCAEDFECFTGREITGVKVTSLPDISQGKLMLGATEISAGDEVKAESLSALRFVPAAEGASVSFGFAPQGGEEMSFVCAVSMLSSLDFSPEVSDVAVSAVENISYSGTLSAKDPEGDEFSFIIVKDTKHGRLLLDGKNGKYVYYPEEDFFGKDKFTYAAKDVCGNVSDSATVSILVEKNKSGIKYADMEGRDEYTAAVSVGERDVIVGEIIGGKRYFYPEKTVTRGDFLVMAMISAGLAPSEEKSGFFDEESLSPYVRGYVSAAAKSGVVFGIETDNGLCFNGDEPITVIQAATVVSRILSVAEPTFAGTLPVLARDSGEIDADGFAEMCSLGFFGNQNASDVMTRADAAVLLCKMLGE